MKEGYLDGLPSKLAELEKQLVSSDIFDDPNRYKEVSREYYRLCEVFKVHSEILKVRNDISESKTILDGDECNDESFISMVRLDISELAKHEEVLVKRLTNMLVPPDPNDDLDTILELRAGTGGDEAALFVADCVRMYQLYADSKGWKIEVLSATESDLGGFKEYIIMLSGKSVYRYMKHESGTHRVQRVPATESQGRIHTSAITIAVMLYSGDVDDIEIDEKDLKIQTCRSSGAGGQHVNKTDSAVRLTHIPSGIVCYCQEERSQLRNREKAMRLLKAKLADSEKRKRHEEISSLRASQVGSGDRSERIRTYNFPQNRVTDHRVNLTLYSLDSVMNGDLNEICETLISRAYGQDINI